MNEAIIKKIIAVLKRNDKGIKVPNKYFCPKCKRKTGVDILYGMRSDIGFGVKLGGCVIKVGQPNRHCFNCLYEWRSSEI